LVNAETDSAVGYLEGERLVKYRAMGGVITITHSGVVEVEAGRTAPEQPTEHFAPYSVVFVEGDVIQSQIQAGVQAGSQFLSASAPSLDIVREFAGLFRELLPAMELGDEVREEALSDLAAVEAQLASPRPKAAIIREGLRSLRAVTENLIASGAFLGLVELLHKLPK